MTPVPHRNRFSGLWHWLMSKGQTAIALEFERRINEITDGLTIRIGHQSRFIIEDANGTQAFLTGPPDEICSHIESLLKEAQPPYQWNMKDWERQATNEETVPTVDRSPGITVDLS